MTGFRAQEAFKEAAAVLALALAAVALADARVNVYFSPDGRCREVALQNIRRAHSTLDVAMYTFTLPDMAAALDSAQIRGVNVRVLLDKGQGKAMAEVEAKVKAKGEGSIYEILIRDGIPVRLGGGPGLMHDKFAVIDDSITITGSYNWTEAAETKNDENMLVVVSPEIARQYETQFETLWVHSVGLNTKAQRTQSSADDTVYVTKSGKSYHRKGCSSLTKSCIPILRSEAEAKGYTPCSRCNP